MRALRDLRVIDFSTGIPGAYASKLFADAGADVVKVETRAGDPLRRWSATRGELPEGEDGALFRLLHTSKRSIVGSPDDASVLDLVRGADLVIDSFEPPDATAERLRAVRGDLVVLSITAFGRTGPYAGRPATEFTIQAESGSLSTRGLSSQPPIMAGGRITDWVGGTFAAVAALAAVQRARATGVGEHVDFSLLEVMNIASTVYADLMQSLLGRPPIEGPARTVEIPSIEPTADGWVGFNTNSRQQYTDFLRLIERPELLADEALATIPGRWARMDEWNEIVRSFTRKHSTAEVVERAALLRIPVAPVNDAKGVVAFDHFRERGVFVENPGGGFLQPRSPYLVDGQAVRAFEPAPALGEHTGRIEDRPRPEARAGEGAPVGLPLEGIRVLDATAWWAGPSATHMLAALGADVIHLESTGHPDGMRMMGGMFMAKAEAWWEWSGVYLGANTNKRDLTLDLRSPRARELARQLIQTCDVVVENFSPRVFESFGLGPDAVRELNPRAVFVRMPAFGLSGPWRDHVGFAQTMEQMTGMAWLTGHVDDQPRIQRGPCDPLAGMHAAFATLVALAERDATGRGPFVEATMVEGALNAASEHIVEYTAYGNVMQREGNRAPHAAPQGLYACRGSEQWLALSIESDAQWAALVDVLGDPEWARDAALGSRAGRRDAHDAIDAALAAWAADRELAATLESLVAAGVPAAPVVDARRAFEHPQLRARHFFEAVDHPATGRHPIAAVPFRYTSVARWLRTPAPTLGQHSREILGDLLGVGADELDALEADGVIGTRIAGM